MNVDIRTASDLVYLLSCAVNRIPADPARLTDLDPDGLYRLAQEHSLLAATAYGLESAGVRDDRFTEAKAKAMRCAALFDVECRAVFAMLTAGGVRYLPLKGYVLKALYPSFGMREMSDIDILCDPDRMDQVREGMEALGFVCAESGESHHDVYIKPPVTFEMHRQLFNREDDLIAYYDDPFRLAVKDDGETTGYHFAPEELYAYLLAHEYKHYLHAGTGLRSLLDVYVFLRRYGEELDRERLDRELAELNLSGFEELNRQLATELFTTGELTEHNREQLAYFLTSGVYGNLGNIRYNKTNRAMHGQDGFKAKVKYFFDVIFLRGEMLQRNYPFFARHKYLLPALYLFRLLRAIFVQPFKTIAHFRYIRSYRKTVDTDKR